MPARFLDLSASPRHPLGLGPGVDRPRLHDAVAAARRVRRYRQRTKAAYLHGMRRNLAPSPLVGEGRGDGSLPACRRPRALAETDVNRFLTRLLASGPGHDIRTVQELLGHSSVETTMVYTHVLNNGRCPVRSPLDQLADHPAVIDGSAPQRITGPRTLGPQPKPRAAQRVALPAPKRPAP